MKSYSENLATDDWYQLLADGGSALVKDATAKILVCFSEAGKPALDADALGYEKQQTANAVSFLNVPPGTSVWLRAAKKNAQISVVK